MIKKGTKVDEPKGKLGVLLPGMGAVASTFIAGVEAIRMQKAPPIGSLTQMGTVRLGKRTEKRVPLIKDFVPLASLDDLVFGGWDIHGESCYETAVRSGVLNPQDLEALRPRLEEIRPWKAVFSRKYVKRLTGRHVKKAKNKRQLALEVMKDIEQFQKTHGLSRLVMIWCGSTEIFLKPSDVHSTLARFERGTGRKRPQDHLEHDLHLRCPLHGHSLCQRGSQSLRGHSGHAGTGKEEQGPRLRQGLQDRSDADEDHHRSGIEVPSHRSRRLVLDQHPGKS